MARAGILRDVYRIRPHRNSPPAILLRESYRDGGKIKKRTIARGFAKPLVPRARPSTMRVRCVDPAKGVSASIKRIVKNLHDAVISARFPHELADVDIAQDDGHLDVSRSQPEEHLPRTAQVVELREDQPDRAAEMTPLYELVKAHVFAAERIHGDDTTVPVLAKTKTRTCRIWTYVRDDRPFGDDAPPAAVFFYSPDRASVVTVR